MQSLKIQIFWIHKVCECNALKLEMNSHRKYHSGIKIKQADYILCQLEGWRATERDGGRFLVSATISEISIQLYEKSLDTPGQMTYFVDFFIIIIF